MVPINVDDVDFGLLTVLKKNENFLIENSDKLMLSNLRKIHPVNFHVFFARVSY